MRASRLEPHTFGQCQVIQEQRIPLLVVQKTIEFLSSVRQALRVTGSRVHDEIQGVPRVLEGQ
jgi:hypothetical protein